MANDRKDENGISRRDFTARLGVAAAGVMVGGDLFGAGFLENFLKQFVGFHGATLAEPEAGRKRRVTKPR